MSVKKVLYIHHGKGLGGAPLSLLYLVQNLDRSKYYPVVLFLHDSEAIDLFNSKDIEIVGPIKTGDFPHTKICWYRWYHPHLILKSGLDTFKTLRQIAPYWLDKIKPDIIHLNTSSLIGWACAAKKKNIPVVWHIREPLADGYFGLRKNFIKNNVKKYATKILPICKNDAKPWENYSRVNVVYNAVDAKKFDKNIDGRDFLEKYNLKKEEPKILFLGGLSKEKGTLELFKIFKKLLERLPEAKLLVAGYFDLGSILPPIRFRTACYTQGERGERDTEYPERSAACPPKPWRRREHEVERVIKYFLPTQIYKRKVEKALKEIEKNVTFLGPIKNVPEAMAATDIVVFPATVGHFARPVIEAGFMAKPVIVSSLSPLNELVVFGKTGFLIDINDKNKWVEKLYLLLTNKKLNQQMGLSAYDFCLKNFDIKKQIEKVETIYSQITY
jgi:glycosyltransferase involved in cell wall biosynthesis